jgi:hypothetical protein
MTTTPFTPIGETARWRIIYNLLTGKDINDVLAYTEAAAALQVDAATQRHIIQGAVRRAAREFAVVDNRALEAVPNTGYRVVEAEEQLRLARYQQRRSSKALQRGRSLVSHADLSGVDPEVRRAFYVTGQLLSAQLDFNRRMDIRQKRLETAVQSMQVRSSLTDEEVAQLRARIERLEGQGDNT